MRTLLDDVNDQLKSVQEGQNWMGANFDKKLNLISDDEAFISPLPYLHSVAEIISQRKQVYIKFSFDIRIAKLKK